MPIVFIIFDSLFLGEEIKNIENTKVNINPKLEIK